MIRDLADPLLCFCCRSCLTDPRLLECGHAVCTRCMLSLARSNLRRGTIRCPLRCERPTQLLSVAFADADGLDAAEDFAPAGFDLLEVMHPERLERTLGPSREYQRRDRRVEAAVLRLPRAHALGEISMLYKKQLLREAAAAAAASPHARDDLSCESCSRSFSAQDLSVCASCSAILCKTCEINEANEHASICPSSSSSASCQRVSSSMLLPTFFDPMLAVMATRYTDFDSIPLRDALPFHCVTVRAQAETHHHHHHHARHHSGAAAAAATTEEGAVPHCVTMSYRVWFRQGKPRVEPLLPCGAVGSAERRLLADAQSLFVRCSNFLTSIETNLGLLAKTVAALRSPGTAFSVSSPEILGVVLFCHCAMICASFCSAIIVNFLRCVVLVSHLCGLNGIEQQRERYREYRRTDSASSASYASSMLEEAYLLRFLSKQTSLAMKAAQAVAAGIPQCEAVYRAAQSVLDHLILVSELRRNNGGSSLPPPPTSPTATAPTATETTESASAQFRMCRQLFFPSLVSGFGDLLRMAARCGDAVAGDSQRFSIVDVGDCGLRRKLEQWQDLVLGSSLKATVEAARECNSEASALNFIRSTMDLPFVAAEGGEGCKAANSSDNNGILSQLHSIRQQHSQMLLELSCLPAHRFGSPNDEKMKVPELLPLFLDLLQLQMKESDEVAKQNLLKHSVWSRHPCQQASSSSSSSLSYSCPSAAFQTALFEAEVADPVAQFIRAASQTSPASPAEERAGVVQVSRVDDQALIPVAAFSGGILPADPGVTGVIGAEAEKQVLKRFLVDFDQLFFVPSKKTKQSAAAKRDEALAAAAAAAPLNIDDDNASEASSDADMALNQHDGGQDGDDALALIPGVEGAVEEEDYGAAAGNDSRSAKRRAAVRHFKDTRFTASALSHFVAHEPYVLVKLASKKKKKKKKSGKILAVSCYSGCHFVVSRRSREEEEALAQMIMADLLDNDEDEEMQYDDEPAAPSMEHFEAQQRQRDQQQQQQQEETAEVAEQPVVTTGESAPSSPPEKNSSSGSGIPRDLMIVSAVAIGCSVATFLMLRAWQRRKN